MMKKSFCFIMGKSPKSVGSNPVESIPQGLKPTLILLIYAGVETPAYPKTDFFRGL
jgi:hypothetical protein